MSDGLTLVILRDEIGSQTGFGIRDRTSLIQDQLILTRTGDSDAVVRVGHGRKVKDKQQSVFAVSAASDKTIDAAKGIVTPDPLKTIPGAVVLV